MSNVFMVHADLIEIHKILRLSPSPLSVNSQNVDSDIYRSLRGIRNFTPKGKYIWKVRIKNIFTALRTDRH